MNFLIITTKTTKPVLIILYLTESKRYLYVVTLDLTEKTNLTNLTRSFVKKEKSYFLQKSFVMIRIVGILSLNRVVPLVHLVTRQ